MSKYYTPKRTKGLFDPRSEEPFKLSRSKIDLYKECPRCFYFDRRLGIGRPPGYPFSLNSAVDALLKKEFDVHRAEGTKHPLAERYGIDAVPYRHEKMDEWRENFKGVQHHHHPTNFIVTGVVDDLWVNPQGEVIVVDYKSTSVDKEITLDEEWKDSYKRQMEVYQWLLRQNNLEVSSTGYFVYCNGDKDKEAFDGKLEFNVTVLPYEGNTEWIEDTLSKMRQCLQADKSPRKDPDCDYCAYTEAVITEAARS